MPEVITTPKGEMIAEHEHLVKLLYDVMFVLTPLKQGVMIDEKNAGIIDRLLHMVHSEYTIQRDELIAYKNNKGGNINKIPIVMREYREGKLKTSSGEKVTNPKQAIAIALSEQRRFNK